MVTLCAYCDAIILPPCCQPQCKHSACICKRAKCTWWSHTLICQKNAVCLNRGVCSCMANAGSISSMLRKRSHQQYPVERVSGCKAVMLECRLQASTLPRQALSKETTSCLAQTSFFLPTRRVTSQLEVGLLCHALPEALYIPRHVMLYGVKTFSPVYFAAK